MSKKNKKKNKANSINKNKKVVKNDEVSTVSIEDEVSKKEEVSLENTVDIEENEKIDKEKEEIEELIEDIVEEVEKVNEIEEIIENDVESNIEEPSEDTKKDEDPLYTVPPTKKSHKTLFIISFILAAIIIFIIFSTVFALVASHKNTIISGIKIKDIDVSGLSKEEAITKVSDAFKEKLDAQITLKHNEYELDVFLGQFDVSFSIEEAVNIAYEKGHIRKYLSR